MSLVQDKQFVIDINLQNILLLLTKLSEESEENLCSLFYEKLEEELRRSKLILEAESNFIKKILMWDINCEYNHKDKRSFPLIPWMFNVNDSSYHEILNSIFNVHEIQTMKVLSIEKGLNSEILARTSDLLIGISTGKERLVFAGQAIRNYICSVHSLISNEAVCERVIRAVQIACIFGEKIAPDLPGELEVLIGENININNITDKTVPLLRGWLNLNKNKLDMILLFSRTVLDSHFNNIKLPQVAFAFFDFVIENISSIDDKNEYREKKVAYLLSNSENSLLKEDLHGAFEMAILAEKEVKKITNLENKKCLMKKVKEIKRSANKISDKVTYQKHKFYIVPVPINDIKKMAKKTTFNIVKEILSEFKGINFSHIIENLDQPFLSTIKPVVSTAELSKVNDKKPESIKYPDELLMKINYFYQENRIVISNKMAILINSVKNRKNLFKLYQSFEEHLTIIGMKLRKELILNAIKYFFYGDTAASLHLLIPQLEEYFRMLLKSSGKYPEVFTNENNNEQMTLSQMFNDGETSEIIKTKYGEEVFTELYLLLLDKRAGNFRNRIFHGVMQYNEFCSPETYYLFGICLYVLFYDLFFADSL
jgi:hypothetical protein